MRNQQIKTENTIFYKFIFTYEQKLTKVNKLIEEMNYDFSKSEIQKQSEKIDKLIVEYIKCL